MFLFFKRDKIPMTPTSKLKAYLIISVSLLIASTIGCDKKQDLSTVGGSLVCYTAIYSKGVYKSDNGGISWYPLTANQDDLYLYSKKLIMSLDSKRLYVTTTGGGLFFIDMEKDALNTMDGFKDEDVRSIVFRKAAIGEGTEFETIVGKRETGTYKLIEKTGVWESLNKGLTYRDVNVLAECGSSLFAGTIQGVFRWDENSKSWLDASVGINNKNIFAVAASADGKTIYAGAGVYQNAKGRFKTIPSIYKSINNGNTWEASDKGLPNGILIYSISVNPRKPEKIYIGTSGGVYRSTDSGNNWSRIDNGLPKLFRALDVKIAHLSGDEDLVYTAGMNGLYMAIDDKNPAWTSRSYGLENTYVSSILVQSN
jgi:photosystem II stability/assembly factor-like uncharacterized protein